MSELEHKCEAGCLRYTCGSYKHVKSCKNYPESQSEIVDNLKFENEKLKAENEILTKDLNCSERAFAFYSMRINELEKEKSRLCDIIANGRHDHVIRKYTEKKEQGG
jgi:uncharacterized protein YpiB (UPF0302 family)